MECIATQFTGLEPCRPAVSGVFQLYVALWDSEFLGNLDIDGNTVTGETKKLAWRALDTNLITQADNDLVTKGQFKDTLQFETAGRYIEDRSLKAWLNYNRLVFVFVGGNGQAFITGEEKGYQSISFKDSTAGSTAVWTFEADTTYNNYGVSSEYLDKIKEATVCGDYTDLFALGNTTTIQEQYNCIVGDYTGFIP